MNELIQATSKNVRTLVDGTLRLTVDISPIHAQAAFSLFGSPDAPIVLARLTQDAALEHAQKEMIGDSEPKGGFLSQWLAMRCNEPEFQDFVAANSNDHHGIVEYKDCDRLVKLLLGIKSKKELDTDKEAEARFHSMIRLPYSKWLMGARCS